MVTRIEHSTASRWAPLWVYAIPIAVINLLRQLVVAPSEAGDAVSIALFAATVVVVVFVVTAVHRLRGARAGGPRQASSGRSPTQ